jgi:hypothetical protein
MIMRGVIGRRTRRAERGIRGSRPSDGCKADVRSVLVVNRCRLGDGGGEAVGGVRCAGNGRGRGVVGGSGKGEGDRRARRRWVGVVLRSGRKLGGINGDGGGDVARSGDVGRGRDGCGEVDFEVTFEREELFDVGHAIPFEVAEELPLHLVELADGEEILADDHPGGIRVGVVAKRFARTGLWRKRRSQTRGS